MSGMNPVFAKIAQDYHLTSDEKTVVQKCMNTYSNSSLIEQIGVRIFNGLKALFGQSDYQKAKQILRSHMKDELRVAISDKEKSASRLQLTEKNKVVKFQANENSEKVLNRLISGQLLHRLIAHHSPNCAYSSIMMRLFSPIKNILVEQFSGKDEWTKAVIEKTFQ